MTHEGETAILRVTRQQFEIFFRQVLDKPGFGRDGLDCRAGFGARKNGD